MQVIVTVYQYIIYNKLLKCVARPQENF